MSSATNDAPSALEIYRYPRSCPPSKLFRVRVNGQPVFVHATGVADFAALGCSGAIEVEVEIDQPIESAFLRPLSRGLAITFVGKIARFTLPGPQHVQIEIDNHKPLHLYANPPEVNRPAPGAADVHYFAAGQVYEVGRLVLRDNETLYIEGGAVVKGQILASGARHLRIAGRGVLDGSYFRNDFKTRLVIFDRCEDVVVEDIIMIEPTTWMLVLGACQGVVVRNLKQIGQVISSDGIDIVGCRDVLIEDCFLKNNDDCVVIKSFTATEHNGEKYDWTENVENILVQNCVLMNDGAGNAMEIGHELRCDTIRNVTFRNIDVLHVHGHGAVFSIHNSDHAFISDLLWEDIRIEHCYDMFIDLRVFESMWGRDKERGRVENVTLRDVFWRRTIYNPGYTKSIIGGWNAALPIRNVTLENIYFDERKITTQDELDLFTKSVEGLVIK